MCGQLKGQQLIYRANAGQHPAFEEPRHNAASMVSALLTLPVLQRGTAAEIASRGGKSVPSEKRSFSQNRDLASAAGRSGGQRSHATSQN